MQNQEVTSRTPAAEPTVVIAEGPVTAQPTQHNGGWKSDIYKGGVRALSIIQIVVGTICVVFQIVLIAQYFQFDPYGRNFSYLDGHFGTGIWCGAFFIGTGVMGLVSIDRKGLGWIVGYMVMNIISCSLLTGTLLIITAISLSIVNTCQIVGYSWSSGSYDYYYWAGYSSSTTFPSWKEPDCIHSLYSTSLALNSIMLLISILQFVVTMIAAIMGCCNTCCREGTTNVRRVAYPGMVHNGNHIGHYQSNVAHPPAYGTQTPYLNQPTVMYGPQQPVGYTMHHRTEHLLAPNHTQGASGPSDIQGAGGPNYAQGASGPPVYNALPQVTDPKQPMNSFNSPQ